MRPALRFRRTYSFNIIITDSPSTYERFERSAGLLALIFVLVEELESLNLPQNERGWMCVEHDNI